MSPADFVGEYLHIMSDPAHAAVEFTFVLIDVLVIDAVRTRWRRRKAPRSAVPTLAVA